MHKDSIDVLVVDDHTLFRKGMMIMVDAFPEVKSVDDACNGHEALEAMKTRKFDLVLLDLDMPVLDGMETSRRILKNYPDTYIIMVSMNDSLPIISELIEMGVHSYLLKSANPEEVQKAITSVISNEFYYNQLVASALRQRVKFGGQLFDDESEDQLLTRREVEILYLICQELTMREISKRLFVSEQTIHTHRKNLMKKTGAKNAVGLVKFAIQSQIISI